MKMILFLLVFYFSATAQIVGGNIKYISASGNDLNNGDTKATPYENINHAVGELAPGDILIFDGDGGRFDLNGVDETFGANSILDATANQPTRFIGINGFEFYNSGSSTQVNFRILADHIVFDNLKFDGERSGFSYMIIQIDDQEASGDAHHVTFQNCIFKKNAIISQRSNTTAFIPNILITHCSFSDVARAIDINEATYRGDLGSYISVTNCSFYGTGDAGSFVYSSYGASGAGLNVWKRNIVQNFNTVFITRSSQWMVTGGNTTQHGHNLYDDYTTFDSESSIGIQSTDQNNIDPLYVDAANNDLGLQAGSPALNAGENFTTLGYKRRSAINASY